jgi:ATP-binding cassette, subfamily C (CFTR/MRP), member 1
MLVLIAPETATRLHQVLLRTVMRAPQSFFAKTDRGKTLNRFSQDMTLLDSNLATAGLVTVTQAFMTIAQAGLIATGSTYMVITIPFLIIGLYLLQHVYLRTSRQLRFLDLEAKSPLYTQFVETIDGLSTIRAFGWEALSRKRNFEKLNASQKPHYLLYCIQRWLNLVLDIVVAALAVIVVALAVNLRSSTNPGLLGIALNNILIFNQSLAQLVTSWTNLETSLGAIARIKKFEEQTEVEAKPGEDTDAPETWPAHGRVELKGISASYE